MYRQAAWLAGASVAQVPAVHSVVMPAQCCSRAAHTAAWHRMSSAALRALWLLLPSAAATSAAGSVLLLACIGLCGCSNPPKHGAAIVAIILSDPELFAQWKASCYTLCSVAEATYSALITCGCRCCHRPLCPACHLLPFLPSLLLDRWSSMAWRNATVSMY